MARECSCSPCAISQMLSSCPSLPTSSDLTEMMRLRSAEAPPRCAAGHVAERRGERLAKSSRSRDGHTDSLRSWRSLLLSGPRVPGVMLTVTGEAEQG